MFLCWALAVCQVDCVVIQVCWIFVILEFSNFEAVLFISQWYDRCLLSVPFLGLSVCRGAKADIVFLTDASWSIGDDNFNKVVKFVFNTVGAFDLINPAGIQVGLLFPLGTFRRETEDEAELLKLHLIFPFFQNAVIFFVLDCCTTHVYVYVCARIIIYEICWSFCKYKGNPVYPERLLFWKTKVVVWESSRQRNWGDVWSMYG